MAKVNFLTDDDVAKFKELWQQFINTRENVSQRYAGSYPQEGEYHQAPEVYVALPATADGIPALSFPGTGTGTAVDSTLGEGNIPGSALCDIFQVIETANDTYSLEAIPEQTALVFNLSEDELPQSWLLVHRDKFGKWFATPPAERMLRFKITEGTAYTGTGTDSELTTAVIYRSSHPTGFDAQRVDLSEVAVGDVETIYADFVRSVFVAGDVVWCKRRNDKWQIVDDGTVHWTGTAIDSIPAGGSGTVRLLHSPNEARVEASCYDASDSIAATVTCLVFWIDGLQHFKAVPVTCPAITAEIGTGTGTGT